MARNRDKNENSENGKGIVGKVITTAIVLVIIAIWLAVFAVLIKLDFNGLGSTVLRPLLKDIPLVNKILPDVPEEQIAYENDYPYSTIEEAIVRIKELEAQNKELSESNTSDASLIQELKAEVSRLQIFEEDQMAFEERVKAFDENVVFAEVAPDIEEYKAYYESIDAANAEEIYRQVVEQLQYSKAIEEKADIYRKMKPQEAADILETMTADIDLVAKMLLTMRPSESSLILGKMDSTAAAKITKKMFDLDEELLND
ncbi:MAG: MotE family protein [Anaerocolumna sp.]